MGTAAVADRLVPEVLVVIPLIWHIQSLDQSGPVQEQG